MTGNGARGWHQRGRAAPIDATAVEVAKQKLIAARHEREARDLVESIANVTRIKIIRALAETPLAAGDIARVVDRTAPATSQHIRVLRDAGVIESTPGAFAGSLFGDRGADRDHTDTAQGGVGRSGTRGHAPVVPSWRPPI